MVSRRHPRPGAFGVDALAHRGVIGADGVTVAVLACGVDVPTRSATRSCWTRLPGYCYR